MIGAILLASISADIGCNHGTMHLDKLTAIGVGIVFFLHGLGLSPKAIKSGVSHWRMHLFIQLTTFVVYPLLWLLLGDLLQVYMPSALAIGFCYLLLLPSTVSSSVAMTSLGKGNVPGAVFNASLSMLLGVFLTPLLVQLVIGFSGATLDFMSAIIALSQQLLLPIIAGQLLRPILLNTLKKHQSWVNNIDKYVILLIVYNAFCNAIINDI